MKENFNGKIILFGEYTIINDGIGLAAPIQKFSGSISDTQESDCHKIKNCSDSNQIETLSKFIDHISSSPILNDILDLRKIATIKNDLTFESNIPVGYGVGSSGALCAAILYEFSKQKISRSTSDTSEILRLKDILSLMEGYYHGSSSGIDPLISYLNRTLMLKGSGSNIEFCHLDYDSNSLLKNIFLIDTQKTRKASYFVQQYLQQIESGETNQQTLERLKEVTENCIHFLVNDNIIEFQKSLYELSKIQFIHFRQMIPEYYHSIWYEGLESGKFLLKLCGAGGGGYILGWRFAPEDNFKTESSKSYVIENLQI
jgi:mevalonate kinase